MVLYFLSYISTVLLTRIVLIAQKEAFGDDNTFSDKGGLSGMGDAFSRNGMVLVMSIWVSQNCSHVM
jgi:hypothetical protein